MIRDKTFIFGDYQGSRLHEGIIDISTVPTAAERAGDFSDRSLNLYDPNAPTSRMAAGCS